MTERFEKFEKWLTPLKEDGHRGICEDAPEEIKAEAKKVNEEYYQRTGRYMLHIDY